MARVSIWQKKFDPDAEYVVSKAFVFGGTAQHPGHSFDRTACNRRRLRQLYEQRRIAMAPPLARLPEADTSKPPFTPDIGATGGGNKPLAIRHVGAGRYRLFRGNEPASRPMTRSEAEAELAISGK